MLFVILVLAFVWAHDTWLFPLLDGNVGLTTGSRFPAGEVGPPARRAECCLAGGHVAQIEEGESYSIIRSDSRSKPVAVKLKPHPITLSSDLFADYLSEEDANYQLPARPIREQYTKCAKLGLDNIALAQGLGHPLEFTIAEEGLVRLWINGNRFARKLITFANDEGEQRKVRTDENGEASVPTEPGLWMARAHAIEPSDSEDFDFKSVWCTLVFRQS